MPNKHLTPDTLYAPQSNVYTQVVTSTGSTTIHVAGQVAFDTEGNVVGVGDFKIQVEKALDNLRLALEAAGAGVKDLVRMRYFIVNYTPACLEDLAPAMATFFGDLPAPASTLLGVASLYTPELMIEIDATAVI
jgi:enamine deaminase RidA (YjgF/YER057c/UK114 family)